MEEKVTYRPERKRREEKVTEINGMEGKRRDGWEEKKKDSK